MNCQNPRGTFTRTSTLHLSLRLHAPFDFAAHHVTMQYCRFQSILLQNALTDAVCSWHDFARYLQWNNEFDPASFFFLPTPPQITQVAIQISSSATKTEPTRRGSQDGLAACQTDIRGPARFAYCADNPKIPGICTGIPAS